MTAFMARLAPAALAMALSTTACLAQYPSKIAFNHPTERSGPRDEKKISTTHRDTASESGIGGFLSTG